MAQFVFHGRVQIDSQDAPVDGSKFLDDPLVDFRRRRDFVPQEQRGRSRFQHVVQGFNEFLVEAAIGQASDDQARSGAGENPEDGMEKYCSDQQTPERSRARFQRPEVNEMAELDPSFFVARSDHRFRKLRE
ncbi:MAG TPA: hypothetical protein VED87_04215 [Methylocystis sp.]|nr:hypothetical protein [Methylocystis sp.]